MNALKIAVSFALLGLLALYIWRRMRPNRTWVTSQKSCEGFPLFLRRPTNVDTPLHRKRYPILVVITHEFSKRNPDGRPQPDYNDTLFDFDIGITSSFDSPPRGVPVLVETFGGKRHYYFYVEEDTDVVTAIQPACYSYPNEKLTFNIQPAPDRAFLDNYLKEVV